MNNGNLNNPQIKKKTDTRLALLHSLVEGDKIGNLLLFRPLRYENLSLATNLTDSLTSGKQYIFNVKIASYLPQYNYQTSRKNPFKIECEFGHLTLHLVFFAGSAKMWGSFLHINEKYHIIGIVKKQKDDYIIMHPKILHNVNSLNVNTIRPIYHLKTGLTQEYVQNIIHNNLNRINLEFLDYIPFLPQKLQNLFSSLSLIPLTNAIEYLHQPREIINTEQAIKRLGFDEILMQNLAYLYSNKILNKNVLGFECQQMEAFWKIVNSIPFKLTDDQSNALQQAMGDVKMQNPCTRLLQGDVGCGKTIVAILMAVYTVLSGYQAVIMAPSFILTVQIFEECKKILDKFNISIEVFTSKDTKKERNLKLKRLESGEIKIAIGTHALISDDVKFHNLGYIIIDEQHRFGIAQRLSLTMKSLTSKALLMSATPIPRTLAMSLSGAIEVSVINAKPAGRKHIDTKIISHTKIDDLIQRLKNLISQDNIQIYWVCPLIEEKDDGMNEEELRKINSMRTDIIKRKDLLEKHFGKSVISYMHGKMKESEREEQMQNFISHKTNIMLATTVIEVGVNVPNATIMIIENAESFGLATLHQLRGRVGRGAQQSYCFLIYGMKVSNNSMKRLQIIKESNDGFYIAKQDMALRGGSAILAKMQSGFSIHKFFDLFAHEEFIEPAKEMADFVFQNDVKLETNYGASIKKIMQLYNYHELIKFYIS